jgi:uncharacterized YigZ family protein
MVDEYLTPAQPGEGLLKEKGSKFLGFLFPIEDEHQAMEILKKMRKQSEFKGANHYCFAYITGVKGENKRSSDDGEPSGTAGKPILQQLESAGLTNCLLVVVRFFGGVLLGTGGLIQSYRGAALETIRASKFKRVAIFEEFILRFPQQQLHLIEKSLKESGANVRTYGYSDEPEWSVLIKPSLSSAFEEKIKSLSYLGVSVTKPD